MVNGPVKQVDSLVKDINKIGTYTDEDEEPVSLIDKANEPLKIW